MSIAVNINGLHHTKKQDMAVISSPVLDQNVVGLPIPNGKKFMRIMNLLMLCALGWPISSQAEQAQSADDFQSDFFGFKLTKPADWYFYTTTTQPELSDDIVLQDEKFRQQFKENATIPMVLLGKNADPSQLDNAFMRITARSSPSLMAVDQLELLKSVFESQAKAFSGFAWITEPEKTKLSGYDAAFAEAESTVEMTDGRLIKSRVRIWMTMREDILFLIGLNNPISGVYAEIPEYQDIIDSIVIGEK